MGILLLNLAGAPKPTVAHILTAVGVWQNRVIALGPLTGAIHPQPKQALFRLRLSRGSPSTPTIRITYRSRPGASRFASSFGAQRLFWVSATHGRNSEYPPLKAAVLQPLRNVRLAAFLSSV